MSTFIRTHNARLYSIVTAAIALLAHYVPGLPSEIILALVAAILGTGETVQRLEDHKTAQALATPTPAGARCQCAPPECG